MPLRRSTREMRNAVPDGYIENDSKGNVEKYKARFVAKALDINKVPIIKYFLFNFFKKTLLAS